MTTLIVTTGNTSLDKYSQELSKGVTIDKIETKMPVSFKSGYNFFRNLSSYNTNLYHFPHQQFARYANFINKPFIITVHDLSLQCSSLYVLSKRMKIYLKFDKLGIKKAKHIIADSEYTKRDLISKLKIPEDRISVVYLGVNHDIYFPQKTDFNCEYILFVGSEQPRKNFPSLLNAFSLLKKYKEFKNLKLVKIGSPGLELDRKTSLEFIEKLNLQKEVIFTGFIPEAKLPIYYSNAACLVLPSLHEGFGLPILEAMACGCPVITSNVTSLPEVTGDSAILIDPLDVESIVSSIKEVLSDKRLREKLIMKGFTQANKFSWDKTATKTLDVYDSIL